MRKKLLRDFIKQKNVTKVDYVLIEKFLQGREFGAQAFISNGEILFVMPHGDILYQADTAVPVGHYVPYECSDVLREKMTEEARKAIKAIGGLMIALLILILSKKMV